jgi:hypothetical protein
MTFYSQSSVDVKSDGDAISPRGFEGKSWKILFSPSFNPAVSLPHIPTEHVSFPSGYIACCASQSKTHVDL